MSENGMTITMKGTKLVIEVDVSKAAIEKAPLSGSGKNKTVASTRGLKRLENGLRIGLNVVADK